MRPADQRDLEQFVEVVKQALSRRLVAVNLDLLDIGLRECRPAVITPGVDQYFLTGWVRNGMTGKVSCFTTRVGGKLYRETSPETVEPLVTDLTEKLIEDFYPTKQ